MGPIAKVIILLSLIFIQVDSYANERAQRRSQIVNIIDQELREVTRLNKTTGSRNPELLLRMAELLLEKARHLKDAENDRYLRLPPAERQRVNRQEFFKRSRQYFIQAQRTCNHILRRFPNFDNKAEVYYILAYNSKEFQRDDDSERFFSMAIREAPRNSEVRAKSQIGLAEIYFNKEDYRRAAPLYEEALKTVDDQWWTKDSYNLAWSLFRTGRRSDAIKLMREVYEKSNNPDYVNMSHSVERDLAYFYTEVGQVSDAVKFYERKGGGDISSNLIRVGRYLMNQGKYAAAETTFEEALNHPRTREDNITIHLQLLNLHERFGNYDKHLRSSKTLADFYEQGHLKRHQGDDLKYHVQNMSARLQQQVAEDDGPRHDEDRQRRARLAVEYFQLFGRLDERESYRANFHAAETQYASDNFNDAIRLYDLAYKGARAANDREIAAHSLDGLMSSLGSEGVSQSVLDQYLEPAYLAFLQAHPRREESNAVFQRLFNHYMDADDIRNAERTLNSFQQSFPNDRGTQEAMLAKVMDYHKDRNNQEGIQRWVARINRGDFRVSSTYAEQVRLLLLSIQFDKVEELTSEGDRKAALRGYVEIYQSDQSSADAKKNAAYNIATLFHELGDTQRTYGWAERALEHMDSSDVQQFESSFLSMATGLFNRRNLEQAAKLNEMIYNKLCRVEANNKEIFFKNANVIHLSLNNRSKSMELIAGARGCGISNSTVEDAQAEHLTFLLTNQYWSGLDEYIEQLKQRRANWPELIFPLSKVRDALDTSGRRSAARQKESEILDLYRGADRDGRDIPIEALDVVADLKMRNLQRQSEQLRSIELAFPEELYNERLEELFNTLDRLTDTALDVLDVGSGKGIVSGYRYLVEAYEFAGQEVANFVPPDQSDSYVQSFQESMSQLANPLFTRARDFRAQALEQINRGDILSPDNYWFLSESDLSLRIKYNYPKGSVLMDRGGRR